MQAMLDDDRRRFVVETRLAMEQEHPYLVERLQSSQVESSIHQAIIRARTYGIHIYNDLFDFVILQFTYGPAFEQLPRFAELKVILSDDGMDASIKMLQMKHWLMEHIPPS